MIVKYYHPRKSLLIFLHYFCLDVILLCSITIQNLILFVLNHTILIFSIYCLPPILEYKFLEVRVCALFNFPSSGPGQSLL